MAEYIPYEEMSTAQLRVKIVQLIGSIENVFPDSNTQRTLLAIMDVYVRREGGK